MKRVLSYWIPLMLAGATVWLGAVAVLAQSRPERPARPARGSPVGLPAPDFNLPLLKEQLDDKGGRTFRITDQTVRLSDFSGRKIVCAFFSSYT